MLGSSAQAVGLTSGLGPEPPPVGPPAAATASPARTPACRPPPPPPSRHSPPRPPRLPPAGAPRRHPRACAAPAPARREQKRARARPSPECQHQVGELHSAAGREQGRLQRPWQRGRAVRSMPDWWKDLLHEGASRAGCSDAAARSV